MENHKKRVFSPEFKKNAVNISLSGVKRKSEIARDLEISEHLLYKWIKDFTEKEEKAFPGKGVMSEKDLLIKKLRAENARLQEERDILKKAVKFFSLET